MARANAFLEAAKEVGLNPLPFQCGFFVTIPCENSEEVYKKLVDKKIHIIPMGSIFIHKSSHNSAPQLNFIIGIM